MQPLLLAALVTAAAFCASRAQNYSLDWANPAPGGTSTGSVYSISGSIGQPSASLMNGGQFSVQGGFWGVIALVQTPGAPTLTMTASKTNLVISWPAAKAGYVLEQNYDLTTTNWTAVGQAPVSFGAELGVTVIPTDGNQFYRLKSQ
jgi:hypothetical protein